MRLAASLLIVAALVVAVLASSGDHAQIYKDCVSSCHAQSCLHSLVSLPLPLRLTRWTCTDNCRYNCMHLITDIAVRNGQRIQQYHGKWPFWRYAGMQEPASVAFSLLNLLFHARGGLKVQRRVPDGHPMKRYYLGFAVVSVNAWVWSSVFHTRDLPITEKMDYFSAALAIVYALFYTVVRLFHLYPSRLSQGLSRPKALTSWGTLCSLAFLGHVGYLTLLPRFDYTYNMAANLVVGMTHNILWLLYSLPSSVSVIHRFQARPKSYRPPYASKAAIFVLLTTAATSLELFDFPPWNRIIDAHSLWHLATVPIAAFWYEFLVQDALDEGWRGSKPEF